MWRCVIIGVHVWKPRHVEWKHQTCSFLSALVVGVGAPHLGQHVAHRGKLYQRHISQAPASKGKQPKVEFSLRLGELPAWTHQMRKLGMVRHIYKYHDHMNNYRSWHILVNQTPQKSGLDLGFGSRNWRSKSLCHSPLTLLSPCCRVL